VNLKARGIPSTILSFLGLDISSPLWAYAHKKDKPYAQRCQVGDGEAKRSSRVAFYSVLANLVVTVCKALLAYVTGSSAVLADAIHGLSDLAASLAVWLGIRISRLSSKGFPFGLYKVENIMQLVTGLAILMAGYEVVRYMVLGSNIRTLSYAFVRYEKAWAERVNSPALMADAEHWKADILSTGILVFSLFTASVGLTFMDRLAALVIVFFIVLSAWKLIRNALRSLLDASVDYTTLDKISRVVSSFPRVKKIKSMAARSSGPCIFAHVEVILKERDLRRAHELTERIEEAVQEAVPHVERIFIHYEPEEKEGLLWGVPLDDGKGTISSYFGEAPFVALLLFEPSAMKLIDFQIKENPFHILDKGKGVKLAEFLLEEGVDRVSVKESIDDKGPGYLFKSNGVVVQVTHASQLDELITQVEREGGGSW
jgi:divalent metal cation (Fe/Co/Zn/Cd) transporter/predicted Fe-Mo cluster-binding NifX family protein